MVRGLDRFKDHFKGFQDRYVLIGGAACDLAMEAFGLVFRATKDLDIVLCVEALDAEFVNEFWEFVRKGGYRNQQKSTGEKRFYRFFEPGDSSYPWMLELFSRAPDALKIRDEAHLTPIPVDEETSGLSAILLDADYYRFIHQSRTESDGVSIVPPECLVPLKARAWLDLSARRDAGGQVDGKDIRKHRNDIFRLFQVIAPDTRMTLPDPIQDDLRKFLKAVENGPPIDMKAFGLAKVHLGEVLITLQAIYGLRR